jgi:hypothetical protein
MAIREFTMVYSDNTAKEETERSESMRHFVVKSVLVLVFADSQYFCCQNLLRSLPQSFTKKAQSYAEGKAKGKRGKVKSFKITKSSSIFTTELHKEGSELRGEKGKR